MRRHGWRQRKGDAPDAQPGPEAAPLEAPSLAEAPGLAAQAPVPDAEIPELRKKEEEKRRGGVFWRGGSPGAGSNLLRAPGGTVFTSPFGLGRIAANLAQRLGGASTAIGRLLLSRAGGWLVLSGIVGGGVAGGILAGLLFRQPQARETAAAPSLSLEDPRSGILVTGPRDKSLSYVQNANQGELNFDEGKPSVPAPGTDAEAGAEGGDGAPDKEAVADAAGIGEVDEAAQADALAAAAGAGQFGRLSDMRGALSSSGRLGGGNFGAGNFKNPLMAKLPDRGGKLTAPVKGRRAMKANDLRRLQGRANRAMGQLKLSRFMSGQAKNLPREEAASQYATAAFDQTKPIGGEMPGTIGTMGAPEVVVPPGTGAPDPTYNPPAPSIPPTRNVTPYQSQLDAARNMGNSAGMLRMMGIMMIIAGIALLWGPWWVKLIGIALIAAGMMMLSQAQNMAKQAKAVADQIKAMQDQTDQAKIATDAAQAKADGRSYTPPDLSDKTKRNEGVEKAVDEQRNATYEFDQ